MYGTNAGWGISSTIIWCPIKKHAPPTLECASASPGRGQRKATLRNTVSETRGISSLTLLQCKQCKQRIKAVNRVSFLRWRKLGNPVANRPRLWRVDGKQAVDANCPLPNFLHSRGPYLPPKLGCRYTLISRCGKFASHQFLGSSQPTAEPRLTGLGGAALSIHPPPGPVVGVAKA